MEIITWQQQGDETEGPEFATERKSIGKAEIAKKQTIEVLQRI